MSAICRLNSLHDPTAALPIVHTLLSSYLPGVHLSLSFQWDLNANVFGALIGPSGTGKSYYLNAILKLAAAGDVYANEVLEKMTFKWAGFFFFVYFLPFVNTRFRKKLNKK